MRCSFMAYALLLILEQRQQRSRALQILCDLRGVFNVDRQGRDESAPSFSGGCGVHLVRADVEAALPWLMQYDIHRSGPPTARLGA
jgi:hypothetical protein